MIFARPTTVNQCRSVECERHLETGWLYLNLAQLWLLKEKQKLEQLKKKYDSVFDVRTV